MSEGAESCGGHGRAISGPHAMRKVKRGDGEPTIKIFAFRKSKTGGGKGTTWYNTLVEEFPLFIVLPAVNGHADRAAQTVRRLAKISKIARVQVQVGPAGHTGLPLVHGKDLHQTRYKKQDVVPWASWARTKTTAPKAEGRTPPPLERSKESDEHLVGAPRGVLRTVGGMLASEVCRHSRSQAKPEQRYWCTLHCLLMKLLCQTCSGGPAIRLLCPLWVQTDQPKAHGEG